MQASRIATEQLSGLSAAATEGQIAELFGPADGEQYLGDGQTRWDYEQITVGQALVYERTCFGFGPDAHLVECTYEMAIVPASLQPSWTASDPDEVRARIDGQLG